MSRKITTHKIAGLNDQLEITAGPNGAGGAPRRYDIIGMAEVVGQAGPRMFGVNLRFQDGPIQRLEDMNGITNESILAVLIDRLQCFQAGPFACDENAKALTHLELALLTLHQRTRDRLARKVEGKNEP